MPFRCVRRPATLLGAGILFASSILANETLKDCPDCPNMVVIRGGTFTMGSPVDELERKKYEGPRAGVRVAGFAIGETEITRKQYAAFADETQRASSGCFTFGFISLTDDTLLDLKASWRNPGFAQSDNDPVVCISWQDASDYTAWLSRKTGQHYRLPSEAEWEYAARAGANSRFFWGDDETRACKYVNGGDPTLLRALPALPAQIAKDLAEGDIGARVVTCNDGAAFTAPVRSFRPNAFGLYDMLGNAWEYVEDCWYEELPTNEVAHVEVTCDSRRSRGGSWDDYPMDFRLARRSRVKPDLRRNDAGFRVARSL
jgi:formylglycine-generating enzyme required for sulfatase activity